MTHTQTHAVPASIQCEIFQTRLQTLYQRIKSSIFALLWASNNALYTLAAAGLFEELIV